MRKGERAERCTGQSAQPNDSRKMRCWGFMMQSSQPEALVRRRGTGAYVPQGTTDRGNAKRYDTTKSLPHRLAQPIFHHKRKTWTAIASCDNWPLLRRLLILDSKKWDRFSIFFKLRFGRAKANKRSTRSSATEHSETLLQPRTLASYGRTA